MSADNWNYCPQCKVRIDALNEARINAPAKAYGKIARDKYMQLVEEAKQLVTQKQTLREDYEVWINKEGDFLCDYGAKCTDCGFSFSFSHKVKAFKHEPASK